MPLKWRKVLIADERYESAGVFDVGHMAEFRVFGFPAFDFHQIKPDRFYIHTQVERLEFSNALLSEVDLPALDAYICMRYS